LFSQWREAKDRIRTVEQTRLEDARETINQMQVLHTEFSIRAQLLIRGMESSTSTRKIADRKKAYDEAAIKLETTQLGFKDKLSTLLQDVRSDSLRNMGASVAGDLFTGLIEADEDIDTCIQNNYDKIHAAPFSLKCKLPGEDFERTGISVVRSLQKCVTSLFAFARSGGFATSDSPVADLMFNTYVRIAGCPHAFER
jgi:hypothetical protein